MEAMGLFGFAIQLQFYFPGSSIAEIRTKAGRWQN
jgi:hypothetical protein